MRSSKIERVEGGHGERHSRDEGSRDGVEEELVEVRAGREEAFSLVLGSCERGKERASSRLSPPHRLVQLRELVYRSMKRD
jgi:hypothetical protein